MKRSILFLALFAVALLAALTFWQEVIEIEKRYFSGATSTNKPSEKLEKSASVSESNATGSVTTKRPLSTSKALLAAQSSTTTQSAPKKERDLSHLADEKIEAFNRLLSILKNRPYEVDDPRNPFYDPLKAEQLRAKLKTRIAVNRQYGYDLAVMRDRLGLAELQAREKIFEFFTTLADHWTDMSEKDLRKLFQEQSRWLESLEVDRYKAVYERALKNNDAISKQIVVNYRKLKTHYLFFREFLDYVTANPSVLKYRSFLSLFRLDEMINQINSIELFARVNTYLRHIHTDMGRLTIFLLIILLAWVAEYLFYYRLYGYLKKIIEAEYHETDAVIMANLEGMRRPFFILALAFGLQLGLEVLYHPSPLPEKLSILFYAIFLATITYIVMIIIDSVVFDYLVKKSEVTNKTMRRELINLIVSILKLIIIVVVASLLLVRMGVNVTGVVASLGIGGLAVALAAQNTLSNFFGLLKIIFDNSFSQGDWIETKDAEGTVVEIGFISTMIRTFDNALITVPNATLANNPLKNWSKRTVGRRIKMVIGVTYGSPKEEVVAAVEEIRDMLKAHPGIAEPQEIDPNLLRRRSIREKKLVSLEDKYGIKSTLLVYLDEFADSSINILIYCFSKSVVWEEWLKVKQDVMLKIWEILERRGLDFAFPSESIYFDDENIKESFKPLLERKEKGSESVRA